MALIPELDQLRSAGIHTPIIQLQLLDEATFRRSQPSGPGRRRQPAEPALGPVIRRGRADDVRIAPLLTQMSGCFGPG